jgi:hypothetical protein
MNIANLEPSSKNSCINYETSNNNIVSKLKSNPHKLKQCCLDIASREVTINKPSKAGYKSVDIITAVKNGDTKYLDDFLNENPPYIINKAYDNDDDDPKTLLQIAIQHGQFNTVKYLVEKGASLDCTPNLLLTACTDSPNDNTDKANIVHYLLTQGAKPPEDCNEMIRWCVSYSQLKTFKILVSHGIKPDFSKNLYHLKSYIDNSKIEYLRYLLENNLLKVNKEYNGLQLIHIACMHTTNRSDPNIEVMKFLLEEYDADPNAQTKSGKATPLHYLLATVKPDDLTPFVELLAQYGVDYTLKGKIVSKSKPTFRAKIDYARNIIETRSKYTAIELVASVSQTYIKEMIQYNLNNKTPEKQKAEDPKNQPTNKKPFFSKLKDKLKLPSTSLFKDAATPSAPPFEETILPAYSLISNNKYNLDSPPAYADIFLT